MIDRHQDATRSVALAASRAAGLRRSAAVVGFAVLTALAARLSVAVPGLPVPLTLQPAAVLLAGALLGSRAGALSQGAYLLAGAAGLPVFAAGGGLAYLLGPTGGYLIAFPAAAALAGHFCRPGGRLPVQLVGLTAALAVLHAGGLAWLAIVLGREAALQVGVAPFLPGDVLKLLLVLLLARRVGPRFRQDLH